MCPLQKTNRKKRIVLTVFVPPCMFFEASQPVAMTLQPCAKSLCMRVFYSIILFICDGCSGKEVSEYWLCLASRQ